MRASAPEQFGARATMVHGESEEDVLGRCRALFDAIDSSGDGAAAGTFREECQRRFPGADFLLK